MACQPDREGIGAEKANIVAQCGRGDAQIFQIGGGHGKCDSGLPNRVEEERAGLRYPSTEDDRAGVEDAQYAGEGLTDVAASRGDELLRELVSGECSLGDHLGCDLAGVPAGKVAEERGARKVG